MSESERDPSRLTTLVEEIEALAGRVRQGQKTGILVAALRKASARLEETNASIQGTARASGVLRGNGVTAEAHVTTDAVTSEIHEAIQILDETPEKYASGDVSLNAMANRVVNIATQAETRLLADWRAWCTKRYTPPDEALLQALQHVIPAEQLSRLRRAVEAISGKVDCLPTTQSDIDAFESDRCKIELHLGKLNIPEEVKSFLVAVGRGASLSMLTEAVSAWLDQHKLAGHFHIVPASQRSMH